MKEGEEKEEGRKGIFYLFWRRRRVFIVVQHYVSLSF